jgi:hypothetical protein
MKPDKVVRDFYKFLEAKEEGLGGDIWELQGYLDKFAVEHGRKPPTSLNSMSGTPRRCGGGF